MRVDGKKTSEKSIFKNYSNGVKTNRDIWVYGSDKGKVLQQVGDSIAFYNSQVTEALNDSSFEINLDPRKMKWDVAQKLGITKGKLVAKPIKSNVYKSYYRPFFFQYLYFDRFWNNRVYQMPAIFPTCESKNLLICSSGVGSKEFSCLMVNQIPCLDFLEKTQSFPRWLPGEQAKEPKLG